MNPANQVLARDKPIREKRSAVQTATVERRDFALRLAVAGDHEIHILDQAPDRLVDFQLRKGGN